MLSVSFNNQEPNVEDEDDVIKNQKIDIAYTIKTNNYTQWSEIWIEQSKVALEHDLTGFFEYTEETDIY